MNGCFWVGALLTIALNVEAYGLYVVVADIRQQRRPVETTGGQQKQPDAATGAQATLEQRVATLERHLPELSAQLSASLERVSTASAPDTADGDAVHGDLSRRFDLIDARLRRIFVPEAAAGASIRWSGPALIGVGLVLTTLGSLWGLGVDC